MKFRLTAPHFIKGVLLPSGTEVGDGTAVPFTGAPSANMEPLDEEAKKAITERGPKRVPVESLPVGPAKTAIFGEADKALKVRETKPGDVIL